ncbi:hypothetical protein QBD01_003731 [Ochrobactrum sp. 19YEA23]|uniref:Lar family restriction alleviation protein n=1 Tax=Ochrobactrum sp. 19YEA23 TaxID=3039854 RepID=UPI0024792121|nr:hypothetical protein [Ochrobactrum sp. 19YEA23]
MASELKPCLLCEGEAKLLRRSGTAGRACPSKWYRERVECKVCGLTTREYKKPGAAAHSWNTRPAPAATDTGLVTCVSLHITPTDSYPDVDVEVHDGSYIQPENSPVAMVTRSQAEELLAAERAEKERLEADNAELVADYAFMRKSRKKWQSRAHTLEAKLAAAEKALEPFAKSALGYDDPDENGPWPDIQDVFVTLGDCRRARAALGGKPS